ncbi:hypothetical protein FB45DRAFT_1059802 [Roridomyces roridus]|uniref:AB hydrolase-1 domain-containing protein n=1 Tax=Roridomyces roridus TaxID=1738132 RepID=A0AAD7FJ65_9AGAR|nr:hypothetical protein FB45DRAFT_1059802 [Roridomyces roridus]
MFSSLSRILLLLVTQSLATHIYGQDCSCSSVVVSTHVDTLIAKDPSDPFGGLQSNATDLRRLNETYDTFGVFCAPTQKTAQSTDVVQLLVHGFSYTNEYWSPATEEFQNQSYAAYACERGLSTFAIDVLGTGQSTRPANASDVQYASTSAVISQLARHLKSTSIIPGVESFKQVIGVGHSAGSASLIYGAIVEAENSPLDALVLTGEVTLQPGGLSIPGIVSGRDDTPLRWSSLDPNYVTVTSTDRTLFYPADTSLFSPRMVTYDGFTKDLGPTSLLAALGFSSLSVNYTGPVAKVVGLQDQLICVGTGRCDDIEALNAAERVLWPKAKSFEVILTEGGHCMNLDFLAEGAFSVVVGLVKQFAGLN